MKSEHNERDNLTLISNTDRKVLEGITIEKLIDSLAEGLLIINDEGEILLINNKFSELTGYRKDEVIGQSINIFIHTHHHEKHELHLQSFFDNPKMRPMGMSMDLEAYKKDGTTFPVEISLSPLKTNTGLVGVAFISNITTRKKAENELIQRNKELDAYAHSVAHDLNSSLMGIIGLSELLTLQKEKLSEDKQKEFLQLIARNGHKMSEIIKELLLFASMKKEDIDISKVDMNKILENSIERLDYEIQKRKAHINLPENVLSCTSYGPWIEEVCYNIVSNAIKYGGTPPIITISSEETNDGYIKYSISDNGEGVKEELKKVIFEDKNATKDHYIKDHGLGLSIVKKIMDKLDCKITVDSAPNVGSTFSFYLKKNS